VADADRLGSFMIGKTRMPVAIVMNMYYTGLGIARSLGERGIRVIGLSAHRGVYGNFTRFAKVRSCPDSREEPEQLLRFLLKLGGEIGDKSIIYPTRDDDVLFLDRFREELSSRFIPLIPNPHALVACLDKWETCLAARKTGVPVPPTWKVETHDDLVRVTGEISFPCVIKPLSAHLWRKADNWERVGARKAIAVWSADELEREYRAVATADPKVLIQEVVAGGDEHLTVVACYMDRTSKPFASFTALKLLQEPEGFGTGCIVETTERPQLGEMAFRLLGDLGFTGIAEVEFKWDPVSRQHKLIEINPRPWDQHRLGAASGIDLIHLAYCDLAGVQPPAVSSRSVPCKWIAEDVLFLAILRSLWRRDGRFGALCRLARGPKIYAIWSWTDPLPAIIWLPRRCFSIVGGVLRRLLSMINRRASTPSLETS
jgi:D-aspartate ligase